MRARMLEWGGRAVGAVLIVLVLWLVGWNDTVTDAEGVQHHGEVLEVDDDNRVSLRMADGETVEITVARLSDVEHGLRGTFRALRDRPYLALLGVLVHLAALFIIALRWGFLLDGAGLGLPKTTVLRLSWIGHFLAMVVPGGLASGDILKALYVAKEKESTRTRALVTAFTDRVLALLVLAAIASTAVLFAPDAADLGTARAVLFAMMGVGAVAAALFYSAGLRTVLRLHHLTRRLPFPGIIDEIREALRLYRRKPRQIAGTLLFAFVGHTCILLAFWLYGTALGAPMTVVAVLVAIPVAQVIAALPGLPGGWGLGDLAFFVFLPAAGVPAGPAVAISFTYRIAQTLLGLPGGLMLSRRATPADREALAALEG